MIFTGGKRSSAVLAACEKRRSGLAPSTTQGPGTKTESSIFGMPTQQVPPGSLLIGLWSHGRGCLRAGVLWGGGGWPSASPLTNYLATQKIKKIKNQGPHRGRSQTKLRPRLLSPRLALCRLSRIRLR